MKRCILASLTYLQRKIRCDYLNSALDCGKREVAKCFVRPRASSSNSSLSVSTSSLALTPTESGQGCETWSNWFNLLRKDLWVGPPYPHPTKSTIHVSFLAWKVQHPEMLSTADQRQWNLHLLCSLKTHLIRLKALSGSTMYLLFTTAAIALLAVQMLKLYLCGLVLLGHRQRDSHWLGRGWARRRRGREKERRRRRRRIA